MAVGNGGTGQRGAKGENWDHCNSIINKIYLKKDIEAAYFNMTNELPIHRFLNLFYSSSSNIFS